ncbi:MAG: protein kinase family protein [Streptosporangiales bacterium]
MTSGLEPGYVLDGRYQLEERAGEQGRATLWRGTDTILARPVACLTLPSAAEETPRVLTAARRASRVADSRVVQVFDTATLDGLTYVVTEWITGRTLTDLLLESGPLDPERAGALVAEAAEALAAAHQVGVSHLQLHPDNLVWTSAGGVKVTGVAIEAALDGTTSDDPERADAQGLGALLYAALTSRWPYGPYRGLPGAPNGNAAGAHRFSPRQVRAGLPPELDATTERALGQRERRGQPPLRTPADIADALSVYPEPAPLDLLFGRENPPPPARDADTDPLVPVVPDRRSPRRRAERPRRSRALVAVPAGVLAIALLGIGGWQLGMSGLTVAPPPQNSTSSSAEASPTPSDNTTPAGKQQFAVVDAQSFDPLGDGSEHPEDVSLAYDGTKRTVWFTDTYTTTDLGNLKPGVGLLFDLGSPRKVGSVDLELAGSGTDLEVRTADSSGSSVDDYTTVAKANGTGGQVNIQPEGAGKARYWLIWITKLPQSGDGYRAGVADVTFKPAG